MAASPDDHGSRRSRRDGSALYQLLTRGLKRSACDTRSIERIIQGADAFMKQHYESAVQLEMQVDFATLPRVET
jgi:hypothetical protein